MKKILYALIAIVAIGLAAWGMMFMVRPEKEAGKIEVPEERPVVDKADESDEVVIEDAEADEVGEEEEIQPEDKANIDSDWVTYRNEEYGFEIEYPNDWKVNNFTEGVFNFSQPFSNQGYQVQIEKTEANNLDDYLDGKKKNNFIDFTYREKMSINAENASETIAVTDGGFHSKCLNIYRKSIVYSVCYAIEGKEYDFMGNKEQLKDYLDKCDEGIKTFKLIK